MADNNVSTFTQLNERHKLILDILTDLMWSTDIKDVAIEDGTTRPTLAKFLAEHLSSQSTYATYDEGKEATGDNGYFAAPDSANRLSGYLVRNGVVTKISELMTADEKVQFDNLINHLYFSDTGEVALSVRDGYGAVALALMRSGRLKAVEVDSANGFTSNGITIAGHTGYQTGVFYRDDDGQVVYAMGADGTHHMIDAVIGGERISEFMQRLTNTTHGYRPSMMPRGIMQISHYGQSQMSSVGGQPAINTSASDYALMFKGGIWNAENGIDDSADDFYDGAPLLERNWEERGETPASQMAIQLAHDFGSDASSSFIPFMTNSAYHGATLESLSDGTENYSRLMKSIEEVYSYAQKNNQLYSFPMFCFWQGGQDEHERTPIATWKEEFDTLISGIENKLQSVTGNEMTFPIFMVQITNSLMYRESPLNYVQQAQQQIFDERDNILMMPSYWGTPIARDNVHFNNITYACMGAYQAVFLREFVAKGNASFRGVYPVSHQIQGQLAVIQFNVCHEGLQFWDGGNLPIEEIDNYGFTAVDTNGNAIDINSVTIAGRDSVVIRGSRAWTSGDHIQYAMSDGGGNGAARLGGQRGNLFDRNGERDTTTVQGTTYPLHIPCIQFDQEIA